jgi:hypothetical protein
VMRAFGGPSLSRGRRKPENPEGDAVPPSGRDLTLIQEAWDHASERGVSSTGTLQRRLDVPALIALVIIVAWTAASVTIAGSQG